MKKIININLTTFIYILLLTVFSANSFSSPKDKNLVTIPAGPFTMGYNNGDKDEMLAHKVYVNQFYISKYEVTNMEYTEYIKKFSKRVQRFASDERFNNPKHPVVGVSWFDARDFCSSKKMRLPTEAEWEKAARGTGGRLYPWGNEFVIGRANLFSSSDIFAFTAPIGHFRENVSPYGLFDTLGNVWEWTSDWYEQSYYSKNIINNPKGPKEGKKKVLRGGSWFNSKDVVRLTKRYKSTPLNRSQTYGIRCAKDYYGRKL